MVAPSITSTVSKLSLSELVFLGIFEYTGGANNLPVVDLLRSVRTLVHIVLSVFLGGVTFVRIHGLTHPSFQLRAIFLIFVMSGILLLEDRELLHLPSFPVTVSATVGLHSGLNITNHGGLFNYYIMISEAVEPMTYIVEAAVILDALTALVVVWGIGVRASATSLDPFIPSQFPPRRQSAGVFYPQS